ncbi:DUF4395 domain-containing protein [Paenibacillus daejeonensis]|uniref:DUF4395 domain-containing protein n=1 Tax=Paenibacillus daejeonensis TaxID=135193 RepID=UPI00036F8CFB|nr:DUF4395 domain-containing protein [Paenibacillus daejeonensis]
MQHASSPFAGFSCAVEVPMHWVRANQTGILLSVIAAIVLGEPLILLVPLAVQLITRWFGIRYNPFVRLLHRLMPRSAQTESRELLRFNNLLAILFLIGALTAFLLQAPTVGYIFVAMLSAAVILALSGFCVGCFIYFQWKQLRARRRQAG